MTTKSPETTHSTGSAGQYVKASVFKAKCLQLMDEVAAYHGEIIITKNNRPVARLVPYFEKPETLYGVDRDQLRITGEIIDIADLWDAQEAEVNADRVLNPENS